SAQYPSPLDMPQSTLKQLVSNHLVPEPVSDLAPRGPPESKVNRDILPKRLDLSHLEVISANGLADNSVTNRLSSQDQARTNESSGEQHNMAGDHILRPFYRKERKQHKQAFSRKPTHKANF